MSPDFYDPAGKPLSLIEWAEWAALAREDLSADSWWRRVTEISAEITVSTVWLGLDHNYFGGTPLIWETMIFGGPRDMEQYRYPSRQSALDHHEDLVRELRAEISGLSLPRLPAHKKEPPPEVESGDGSAAATRNALKLT